jgi:antitoxin MazE
VFCIIGDDIVQAKLIRIGNSQGVRLPQAIIKQAGLEDELDIVMSGDAVIIRPHRDVRSGWGIAASMCHEAEEDLSAWDATINDFEGEW